MNLGHYGFTVDPASPHAHEIEDLGFGTLWVNGGQIDRLDVLTDLLAATGQAVIAPAIIPPDVFGTDEVIELYRNAEAAAPGRLMIGLGSSHQKPLAALSAYVDDLDPIPRDRRLLAAFGPRTLDIARNRFAGAMPGMVTPDYTATARQRLGDDAQLIVGQYAVLDTDPHKARATARTPLRFLMDMRSYTDSARRQGFTDHDIATLSDALVDSMVAWGNAADIAARARQQLAAGADHVYLSVLSDGTQPAGVDAARLLASALRH
ncbi:TIGR03620 family F420-dependent LLM class oxidoreductase [Mycolicibacterium frederiksbergense]|uniref:TIGR03620 family F420-dependent LLM class oxidoreductase n=1 Tax=Mycolicibacterium frederiksbergense TaxID=117567 RepID=A0A6H0SAK8_9MYCO|nr:TIGR03620 family F420-dependent LLM class oxidoreductase [Mycolicibacterium frederiksbergense]QIV84200.1 TIGR03620 family F420-dependent LLM class oxidoreductase [Mycolicibacterium frederiksbergense]